MIIVAAAPLLFFSVLSIFAIVSPPLRFFSAIRFDATPPLTPRRSFFTPRVLTPTAAAADAHATRQSAQQEMRERARDARVCAAREPRRYATLPLRSIH